MRAFITGVDGQDGSYLAERLLAEGVEVHALSHHGEAPNPHVPTAVVRHPGDLTDVASTRALLLDVAPSEVYNLAALSSVATSWQHPDLTASVNGAGAVALLESARQVQDKHGYAVAFVQPSSAEIFGAPADSPQDESSRLRPVNPYGAAKAYAHLMVGVHRDRGLHAASLILYNHESPRRPARFVTRKISRGVADIASGRSDRLLLGNLDARRDWGWAPDYVDAMVRAARAPTPGDFVIATGKSRSVRDFVTAAFARAGIDDWTAYVSTDPELVRPADPHELVGNATRARTELGWTPTVTFEELVGRMVDADAACEGS